MNFYATFVLNFPFQVFNSSDEFAAMYSRLLSPSRPHSGRTRSDFFASKLFNFPSPAEKKNSISSNSRRLIVKTSAEVPYFEWNHLLCRSPLAS